MAARSMFCCRAQSLSVYFSWDVSAFRQLASGVLFVDILYVHDVWHLVSVHNSNRFLSPTCLRQLRRSLVQHLVPSVPTSMSINKISQDAVCDMLAARRLQNVKHTATHAHVGLRVDSKNPFIEDDRCRSNF